MNKARSTFRRTPPVSESRRTATGARRAADVEGHPITSVRWLIGALLVTGAFTVICLYGTICFLYWQGQWQIVFHPARTIAVTPAAMGLRYDNIRFDATETGVLQLTGWWIGADPGARFAGSTLLFLHDGSGSLAASVAQLRTLHQLGINIFAFDYRGFGASANTHPSEEHLYQDADSAWRYLTDTRGIAPGSIVIYGEKLGGAAAVECGLRHSQAAAVILEDLPPPTLTLLDQNPRVRWLPKRLLFHDRFDPNKRLTQLPVPKLFLTSQPAPNPNVALGYYAEAESPKSQTEIEQTGQPLYMEKGYLPALDHFLGANLKTAP